MTEKKYCTLGSNVTYEFQRRVLLYLFVCRIFVISITSFTLVVSLNMRKCCRNFVQQHFLYMLAKDEDSNFGTRALYVLVGPMVEAAAINKSTKRKFR
jgi:hypothetical protein